MLYKNSSIPLLSVIVPVARMSGRLALMQRWLTSISNLDTVEVIVVHDKQDEETGRELREILNSINSDRCILIEEFVNSPGLARNLGLKAASGIWVIFADSDDNLMILDIMENLGDHRESEIDAYIYNFETFDVSSKKTRSNYHKSNSIRIGWTPGIWRWVFRRESIERLKFPKYKMGEDQLFLMQFLGQTRILSFQSQVIYSYVTGSSQQLTNSTSSIAQISDLLSEMRNFRSLKGFMPNEITEVMYLHLILTSIIHASGFEKISQFFSLIIELASWRDSRIRLLRILRPSKWEVR